MKKASDILIRIIHFSGSALLTIFAAMFALVALSCVAVAIIEGDFFSLVTSAVMAFIAWVCWSVRMDTQL